MAHRVLTNCKTYLGSLDISGDTNSVALAHSQAEIDDTSYPSGATATTFKARLPGLQDGQISMAGASNLVSGGEDEVIEGKMGVANVPIMIGFTENGTALGAGVYFGLIQEGSYQTGGQVGARATMTLTGMVSQYELVAGAVELPPLVYSTTNNGVLQNLGAVASNQKLYAALHTLSISGTSFVAKVVSSATQGGAHTVRATFTTVTGVGAEFLAPTVGPFTDTWWGIDITTVTGPTLFSAIGAVGIR